MELIHRFQTPDNASGQAKPELKITCIRPYIFRKITTLFLLLVVSLPLSAAGRMERYEEVLQKTAADSGFDPTLTVSGKEGQEFYTINLAHPSKGVTLGCMVFRDKQSKKALFAVANTFGKAAEKIYGTTPEIKKHRRILEGIKVLESDSPAHDYKNEVMKWAMPRTRGMRVDLTPLVSFSVTVIGGASPEPYMVHLLKNLKATGLLTPEEEGVSFRVIAEKDGYIPDSKVVDTGNISPSSITVNGQVMDDLGKPVPDVKVTIPSLKETGKTDAAGHFWLSVETKGSNPFSTSLTLTLKTPTTGMMVSFENPEPLMVPGDATIKIMVKDDMGNPVKAGRVKLKWTVPDFVITPITKGKLNRNGTLIVPVQVYAPSGPGQMLPEPSSLQVKLEVEIIPEDGGEAGSASLEIPLNLSMIIGTTVGPEMKPRPEKNAPQLFRMAQLLMAGRWEDGSGKFRVLVHPLHPVAHKAPKEWWLAWSDEDHLPLEFPVTETPQPGKVIDVGMVDVLTPDEHENRLRNVAAEFFAAMPLTPSEQSGIQSALRRMTFMDGGVSNVPYYTDNFTNDTGVIHIPATSKEYWSHNLNVENDAAYEIIPHELGHFVHHHLVERFSYINMCYNKLSTGTHTTWTIEPGQLPVKLPYISFSENTADFFALLFRNFWETRHPEIKDSLYFKRPGYLQEFENDEKAMQVVASMEPGYMVEGVQTRFLRVFYGNASQTRPTSVFSDYLNVMLLYMDRPQGWLGGLVNRPARTIYQWIETRQRMPGAFGPAKPMALATRYRLIPGAPPAPTATIAYGEKTGGLQVDRKEVDFSRFPVVPVPFGSRLKITAGTISIDLSDMDTRRTITLKAPAEIVLESRTEITVLKGLVGADFPVTLATPGGKVTPMGTVVQVHVSENGTTEVNTLEGSVRVISNDGSVRLLKAGQSISMDAAGILTTVSACNPMEILTELLPKVTLPPIPAKRVAETGTIGNWQQQLASFPWWALIGAVLFIFLAVATLMWLLRRLLAALIIAPLVAAGVLVIGRLILTPVESENFSFAILFVSPWSAWNINADWLPAMAWLMGGLIAGFILRGWFRGLVAGFLVTWIPWILFHLPAGAAMPGNWQAALTLGQQIVQNMQVDLLALMATSGLGGFISGLLIPVKHQNGTRRHRSHSHDDDWDVTHSQTNREDNFFDHAIGGSDDE